ncbi:MAG: hypothetical protein HYR85_10290 [Planctomycetes bacterium]|nr:hypothetical protein [Planctomycetota bacterium]
MATAARFVLDGHARHREEAVKHRARVFWIAYLIVANDDAALATATIASEFEVR